MPTASDLPGNLHGDTMEDEGDPPPGFPPPKPPRDERPDGAIKHARTEHEPIETKYSAKHPPRLPTRVIQNPKFPVKEAEEEEVEEIEEDIAKEMGPEPKPKPPPPVEAPEGPVARKKKEKDKEPEYQMVASKVNPAHGPCDPAVIFEQRARLEEIKSDVAAHVCLDPYKAIDNALLDLQDGFDRGIAKCANQSWVSLARQKAYQFHACIKAEVRAAPHITPQAKADIAHKLRASEGTIERSLIWPDKNVSPSWSPEAAKEHPVQAAPTPEEQKTIEEIQSTEEENPIERLPAKAKVHLPKGAGSKKMEPPKPKVLAPRPEEPKDTARSPWTEAGAPESWLRPAYAPVSAAVLLPDVRPCGAATRRRRAEGFLCRVKTEHHCQPRSRSSGASNHRSHHPQQRFEAPQG